MDGLSMSKLADALEAAVARANQLEKALNEALDAIVWMSGASDFGSDGVAHEGWKKVRDEQLPGLFALAGVPAEPATEEKARMREVCPDQGRYGFVEHIVVDGTCYTCQGEEAARRARNEERGHF